MGLMYRGTDAAILSTTTAPQLTRPCIKIHDIARFNSTPSGNITALIGPTSEEADLSIVGAAPYFYTSSGTAVLFDPAAAVAQAGHSGSLMVANTSFALSSMEQEPSPFSSLAKTILPQHIPQ